MMRMMLVDFFLVLMMPNAGDEWQGIKKGIMELADALIINKCDGESVNLANKTKSQYQSAVNLLHYTSFWTPKVMTCSSVQQEGMDTIWGMMIDYYFMAQENNAFANKRSRQNIEWMRRLMHELVDLRIHSHPEIKQLLPKLQQQVTQGVTTPYVAAKTIIAKI